MPEQLALTLKRPSWFCFVYQNVNYISDGIKGPSYYIYKIESKQNPPNPDQIKNPNID